MKTNKMIGRNLDDGLEEYNPRTGQTTVCLASELGLRSDLASNGTVLHEPIDDSDYYSNEEGIKEEQINKLKEKKSFLSPNTRKKEIESWADQNIDEETKQHLLQSTVSNDSFEAIAQAFHEKEEKEEGIENWVDSQKSELKEPILESPTALQVFRQNRDKNINLK